MIAFDTSLLVRIAVGDDPEQKAAALALAEQHRFLIPKTVVLETEWVLRSRYGLRPTEILGFLSFRIGGRGDGGRAGHSAGDTSTVRTSPMRYISRPSGTRLCIRSTRHSASRPSAKASRQRS